MNSEIEKKETKASKKNYALACGILAAACVCIAIFFTESQAAFLAWLSLGIVSAFAGDVLAWLQPIIWRWRRR